YYADPDDVPDTLPNTSRPPVANTQSGTPNVQRPVDNLDRPLVHAEPDLAQINTELDRWGNNVHQWASSTFPRKLDGIAGGKVTATCAPDGSLVFDAGLPRYP